MTNRTHLLPVAAGLLAALLAAGCTSTPSERTAGGEDFPNTLEALGRALAEGVDSSANWSGLEEASTASGSAVYPESTDAVAGRISAASCRPASDTGLLPDGWAWISNTRCPDDGGILRDSLVVRPSDTLVRLYAQDSSGPLGLVRRIDAFRPDSGDGFRQTSWPGRIRLETVGIRGRWRVRSEVVLDAGPDLAWSTQADNRLWKGGRILLRGTDTLDGWRVRSWPDSSVPVFGPESGDSGRAHMVRQQILSSGAVRTESSVLMAFRADSLNYPIRHQATTRWNATTWTSQSILGTRPDSSFRPGDSVLFLRRGRSGADSLREEILFLASPSPRDRGGDRLLALRSVRFRAAATERRVTIEATPSASLGPGAPFTDGAISLRVERSDGATLSFRGTMASGVASGRWRSDTDSGSVVLDSRGRVLSTGP